MKKLILTLFLIPLSLGLFSQVWTIGMTPAQTRSAVNAKFTAIMDSLGSHYNAHTLNYNGIRLLSDSITVHRGRLDNLTDSISAHRVRFTTIVGDVSTEMLSDSLSTKQNTLVSGTTIKTINTQSLLGSGNITITGGTGTFDTTYIYQQLNNDILLQPGAGITLTPSVGAVTISATNASVDSSIYITVTNLRNQVNILLDSLSAHRYEIQALWDSLGVTQPAPLNQVPFASAVNVTGTMEVGNLATVNYTYNDNELDAQGTSTFRWFRANTSDGSGQTVIAGQTSNTYTLAAGDNTKYIGAGVTPVALTGNSPGDEVIAYNSTQITSPSGLYSDSVFINFSYPANFYYSSNDPYGRTWENAYLTGYNADDTLSNNWIIRATSSTVGSTLNSTGYLSQSLVPDSVAITGLTYGDDSISYHLIDFIGVPTGTYDIKIYSAYWNTNTTRSLVSTFKVISPTSSDSVIINSYNNTTTWATFNNTVISSSPFKLYAKGGKRTDGVYYNGDWHIRGIMFYRRQE